jgi:hypothetical protein
MNKFFKRIYEILSHKYFRIFLCVFVIVLIFGIHFDKKLLKDNKKKIDNVIKEIKKNNIDGINRENNIVVIKKEIVPEKVEDLELRDKQAVEGEVSKFSNITNIFVKMKILEERYLKRVENKKLNYKRIVKYGDFIYYSQAATFKDKRLAATGNNKKSNLFINIKKGDFVSEKLIGKKIGDKIKYSYIEMLNSLDEENKKNIDMYLNSEAGPGDKRTVREIIDASGLEYESEILDFIPIQLVEELKLSEES